jgi:hypothetical protein
MPLSPMAARMMLRPIRPNPLIPTLIAICGSSTPLTRDHAHAKQLILMNGLRRGQTPD